MGIRYSGNARTGTFNGDTRLAIVDGLKAALESAGWTVASGSSGDWKLNSGTTPSGHQIRVRIYDPGGGAQCARLRIMNVSETIAPDQDVFLQAVSDRVYRWFACPYQFFVLVPGTFTGRSFACGGVPWLPPFLNPANCGWLGSNGYSDSDPQPYHSFRRSTVGPFHQDVAHAVIYGSTGWGKTGGHPGSPSLLCSRADGNRGQWGRNRLWQDGSVQVFEPLIGMNPSQSNPARLVGQLWDAIIVEGEWPLDPIISFDGSQWWGIYFADGTDGHRLTVAVLYPTS